MEHLTVVYILLQILALIAAVEAVYWSRTSQGAVGWGISLLTIPAVALPIYLFLGRNRFRGHSKAVRKRIEAHRKRIHEGKAIPNAKISRPSTSEEKIFEDLTEAKFIDGNKTKILKDGKDTFAALFTSIKNAQNYILLQFYTVRNDEIGNQLKNLLIEKARQGVKVYFMYDAWGSTFLPRSYINELNQNGCEIRPFEVRQKLRNFFQLNFRNHRKIMVVDGQIGFVGGINIGDEYCVSEGKHYWRDTQFEVRGPIVLAIQASFVSDWYWATSNPLKVNWDPTFPETGDKRILPVLTGPADNRENCTFFFMQAILSAKKRIWISSPYFVPDEELLKSIQLASLRGVEVKLLLPKSADHYLTWLASFAYMPLAHKYGAQVYRYASGFIHQKAFLIDDDFAAIGSANLDYRSVRLNFEVMLLVSGKEFNGELTKLFEADLAKSELFEPNDLSKYSFITNGASKFARLFAPLL